MTPDMYAKAIASIREFGFVDPVTVRSFPDEDTLEIIDGEHRVKAALDEGLDAIPVFDLGIVSDDHARLLTIVLNETRGQADPEKLASLLKELRAGMHLEDLIRTLPYDRAALDRITGMPQLDMTMPEMPKTLGQVQKWVERMYRMPPEAALVLDEAIEKYNHQEGATPDWRVLEMLAADYLGK